MSTVLVFLQHNNGSLLKASLSAISAARQLQITWKKSSLAAVCLGPGSGSAADQALGLGLETVYFSEDSALSKYFFAPYAAYVHSVLQQAGCDTLVAAATSTGKELTPRIAAMFDAAQASDIIGVNADGTLRRPMYAGNIMSDIELLSLHRCVTVRPTSFTPAAAAGASGKKVSISFQGELPAMGDVVSYQFSPADRPALQDAASVVSGGRGLPPDGFPRYIFPLADALGAAVGASRAAVDAGLVPNDWQVGQTGRVVAPQLYIAAGISGAIQHISGMKDSRVIVAINKDPDAPIFEVADYGIVGDLTEVLPALTESIKKIKRI